MTSMSRFQLSDETIASIIEASPIGMLLVNNDGEIVFVNRKCKEIFGYSKEEFLKGSIDMLIPQRFRAHHAEHRADYSARPEARPMGAGRYLEGVRKNGRDIPVEVGLSPIVIGGERLVLVSVVDMSDRYLANRLSRVNRTLKLEATHDDLTGLPNRRLFLELFEKSVNSAMRRGSSIALMYVDLDGFKKVNDENGHDVGDALLCEVASILSRNVRKGDIVARIGGDEFIVSLIDTKDAESVVGVGKKLIKEISSIEHIGNCQIDISASIGAFRTAMTDSKSLEMLINTADKLMYEAKKAGKGRIVFRENPLSAGDRRNHSVDSDRELPTN